MTQVRQLTEGLGLAGDRNAAGMVVEICLYSSTDPGQAGLPHASVYTIEGSSATHRVDEAWLTR